MEDNSYIYVAIAIALIIQGLMLYKRQKRLKKQMKDIENKVIEWYGPDVVLKTKNYPDIEIKDDFREEVGEVRGKRESDRWEEKS